MADEFFMNTFPSTMPTWESISSSMDIHRESPPNCFISPPPVDHFDSALSSMVSSPTSAVSGDHFMIRELIGRLGNISAGAPTPLPLYINQSNPNSCYGTPLSSPSNMANENFPNLPAMPSDPGFAERAAKFSSFGSRSFNGRTTQIRINNANNNGEFGYRTTGNFGKLQRVFSSPSLIKEDGSQDEKCKKSGLDQGELSNSRENSSLSGQNRDLENGSNRKRKAAPKGKTQSPLHKNSNKVCILEESNAKRSKSEEEGEAKTEENRVEKQSNCNSKGNPAAEPLKDYIHVRARRGQATDSHSLAERVRREKISERMKLLQDLVPGCNKVTGKALMLDEIINYVQSLQKQVEFLSMKLSTVNSRLEFNMDNLFSKDGTQANGSSMQQNTMYEQVECLAERHYNYNQQINQSNISTTIAIGVPPMDPLNHHSFPFHPIPNAFPQIASLCEGDLQSIVQMSYGNQMESGSQTQLLHGTNETPVMKIEF